MPARCRRRKGHLTERPHRRGAARGQDVVVWRIALQDAPHALHVVPGVAPVALGVEVAEVGLFLQAQRDPRHRAGDLARHERLAPARALVVKQDAVGGVDAVGLPVVDRDPVRVELRHAVRAAGVERRRFRLRRLLHLAVELRGGGLVEAGLLRQVEYADRLQEAERAEGVDIGRVLGRVERDLHVALGREVVDLVGPRLLHNPVEVGGVREVAVMEEEAHLLRVGVGIEVIDTVGVKLRRPPLNAVHLVALT